MKFSASLLAACASAIALPLHAQEAAPQPPPSAVTPPIEIPAVEAADLAPAAPEEEPLAPEVLKLNSSYALGYRAGSDFAQQFGRFGVKPSDLDSETFLKAFMDAFSSADPALPEEELNKAMTALGTLLEQREKELATENLEAGKQFLAENGKREGVTTTPSGLQYEVIEKGGEESYKPAAEGMETQFMVNYVGMLPDGTEFDKSPPGEPLAMGMDVVEGFREALTTMPIGAKWKVFIPSELAYGPERRGPDIAPNSVLVFELGLEAINELPAQPAPQMPFNLGQ